MASAPNENVQFTVYRPKTLVPETWQTLLAFAHLAETPVDGLKEKFDPVREVQAQAAAILGKSVEAYQQLVQDSAQPIPREGELCFAPEADGIEFNPPRRTFVWRESVHLEVFLVRAPAALAGLTIRGRLSVFLGSLLIGEVPLNFLVGTGGVSAETADSMEAEVGHHYRRIFASYSHKDAQVVGELQSYARILGDDYLRDVSSLRAGEDWNERLMELIRTADVFQLFWSWNSIDSPFVRQEYEYATRLGRENFIRPVYWEEPLPARPEKNLPPDELRRLHFHRLPTQPAPPESRRTDSGQAAPLAGAKSSSQKFIARNRAPRVQIEYDLEYRASAQKCDLPFVLGVMADLSGKPEESHPPVSDRKMLEIDVDNFDDRMKGFKPRVAFQVPNTLTGQGNLIVDLSFQSMDDFSPGAVARKVGALSELLGARTRLANLLTHVDDETRNRPHAAERTLAELAELDRKLTEQVNPIMHHEDFQKLEGSWRGLYHLVTNTETDEKLKIRVMSISKKEAGMALKKFKRTAWDQSPLFKIIYENEFGTPGGTPFGCLIGDYEFDHSASDVEMLGEVAKISAAAHTPFITAAAPSLCNMETWQELSNPRDLTKILGTPEHAAWRSLRESEDAKYIGMTLPRFLSRVPYGKKTAPVEEFDFEEETERADTKKYTWSNAAYAMGANIARAFKIYGWCARIWGVESGGLVEGLPVYRFPTDDGGMDMKCPTEIGITDCREAELGRNGFLPMLHWKNRDYAVFIGAQSLHKPAQYDDPVANANANLSARLPYLFAAGRFAHILQSMVQAKVGDFRSVDDMTDWLNRWLASYIESDPGASDSMLAQRPLSHAQIRDVVFNSANCFVTAIFSVLPRYQLEALTQPLRLKMKFPAVGIVVPPDKVSSAPSSSVETEEHAFPDEITSDAPLALLPFQVLDSLMIQHGSRTSRLAICHGDITQMPPSEAVDVLVVSSFPGEYGPAPGSVIGALHDRGVSVKDLAQRKAVDLRHAFSCWLSEEVPAPSEGIQFKRILCFEPLTRGRPTQVVGEIFQSLMPFAHGEPPVARIALPLVACGYQGVEVAEMLEPLVNAAVHWITHGLPVDDLKIVAQSTGQAAEMQRVFSLLKPRYSQIVPTPPRKLQYDLFISYSHQNAETARLLMERLRRMKQDLRVFLDRNEIDAGASWQQKIFDALDDCRVVVAVYSPDYLESKVCKEEFNIAWIRHRESAEGVLVPVYLFSATLPTYMKLIHFIDCREGDEDKLAAACEEILSRV